MKKSLPLPLTLFCVFSLLLAGCGAQATPEVVPLAASQTPQPAPTETETPAPTQTATAVPTIAPTATPEPIPCTIAFDSNRDGNREIYRMAPDGSDLGNLSNNPADDWAPAWSPDGKQVAFVSNRENDQGNGQLIYVMNADGSSARQLSFESGSDWPDWSHDGSRITYSGNDDIYVIDADGNRPGIDLTNSPEKDTRPTWSPDGSQIAWLSGDDWNWNVFVMDADGSNARQITDNGQVTRVEWTVDGRIFTDWGWKDREEICHNCVVDAEGANIIDAGGKGEVQRYLPFWTADGNRVELVQVALDGNNDEIYLVGEIFPDIFYNLTNNPAQDLNPDWPANCGPGMAAPAAAPVAEAATPEPPDEIVLGYAGDTPSQAQRKEDFQKACDELSVQCVYGEIPELLDQGVSAIVQNANAKMVDDLAPAIRQAEEKGAPVFVLDAESGAEGAYNVTINHSHWAKTGLGWMFEKLGGQGQFAYFDIDPVNRYTDTINDLLARYPGMTAVEWREGEYGLEKVKPETVDFIKAYPELKAIWTSVNMTDAIHGMQEAGIPTEQWPLINCDATLDGLETWARIRTAYPAFDCIALVNPPGVAYDAAYAAYYLANGTIIDKSALEGPYGNSLYVDMPAITDENLPEWLETARKEHTGLVDVLMSPEEIMSQWFLE